MKTRCLFADVTTEESATVSGGVMIVTVSMQDNSITVENKPDEFNFNNTHQMHSPFSFENQLPFLPYFMNLKVEVKP
jgi:hypothetical protein